LAAGVATASAAASVLKDREEREKGRQRALEQEIRLAREEQKWRDIERAERVQRADSTIKPDPTITVPSLPQPVELPMAPKRPVTQRRPNVVRPRVAIRKGTVRVRPMPPPSTIALAPVNIGNTIRGFQNTERDIPNGKSITGRDFMFSAIGTNSVGWSMVGGAPLTPASFVDSNIRMYMNMYNQFRFVSFTVHYITSSPTSANGDIMFYYGKNRESVFLDQTSANLLPFVISDPNTVLGPQWQNASAKFTCSGKWKSTDYGMDAQIGEYADGELFLLSKTTSNESPGYVLFDYVIEFREKSISPRLLTLPVTRALWNQCSFNLSGATTTNGTVFNLVVGGNNISGAPSVLPPGTQSGDIFKIILDYSNSVGALNPSFVLVPFSQHLGNATATSVTLQNGSTFYASVGTNNLLTLFFTAAGAYSNSNPLVASGTGNVTVTLQFWMSYVGASSAVNVNPNF
jgi:hypothetical protein